MGQILIKLVRIKTPAIIRRIVAVVPDMSLVKYRTPIKTAVRNLMTRSVLPMFAFMFQLLE